MCDKFEFEVNYTNHNINNAHAAIATPFAV